MLRTHIQSFGNLVQLFKIPSQYPHDTLTTPSQHLRSHNLTVHRNTLQSPDPRPSHTSHNLTQPHKTSQHFTTLNNKSHYLTVHHNTSQHLITPHNTSHHFTELLNTSQLVKTLHNTPHSSHHLTSQHLKTLASPHKIPQRLKTPHITSQHNTSHYLTKLHTASISNPLTSPHNTSPHHLALPHTTHTTSA